MRSQVLLDNVGHPVVRNCGSFGTWTCLVRPSEMHSQDWATRHLLIVEQRAFGEDFLTDSNIIVEQLMTLVQAKFRQAMPNEAYVVNTSDGIGCEWQGFACVVLVEEVVVKPVVARMLKKIRSRNVKEWREPIGRAVAQDFQTPIQVGKESRPVGANINGKNTVSYRLVEGTPQSNHVWACLVKHGSDLANGSHATCGRSRPSNEFIKRITSALACVLRLRAKS